MSRYFDVARGAIERHGGTVEKFIGDAVMAVFGVPSVHEDDALRAVRAALELRDGVEIDVRIGVNTGEVVSGGADTLATGDAVNVAARLEQAAASGEVLIGEETYRLVRGAVEVELLPPLEAKGKSAPLTAYRLVAVTGEPRRHRDTPMLGRARELELLRQAYERSVEEQACHLFTILGTAGIGKSRLVEEFLADLLSPRILGGRCLSYGEGITYWPVVEVLKQLGSLPEDEAVRGPLEALLGAEDAHTSPQETAWAVRKALETVAFDRPLVVVFDDIQWGEPTFLGLIEHIADLSRGAPILLLCMARPELLDVRPGWGGGKHNATSVLLEPLGGDETETLVRLLLDGEDGGLAERIGGAAEGNPLFVEEMVELARESGGEVAVPPTIHALLAARLDSLPLEERTVLERGAVEGQVFHRGAVAALAPEERQVDSRLAGLVRKELVRPETATLAAEDAYRFRHLLIRDAAYESLPKATRIELHERFADWLGEHGADLVELDEIVGYHLEQASRYAEELGLADPARATRAASRLSAAAKRAEERGDVDATLKLATRAEALFARDDQRRRELLPLLGAALYDHGRLAESSAVLEEAIDHGDTVTSARARIIRTRSRAAMTIYRFEESFAELDRALAELDGSGEDAALAEVYAARCTLLFYKGRTAEARDAGARALEYAQRSRDPHLEGLAFEAFGTALNWSDTPWPEIDEFYGRQLASGRFGPRSEARLLAGLARAATARGDIERARTLLAESRRRLLDMGYRLIAAAQLMVNASTEWTAGDWDAMERTARSCWNDLGELREQGFRSTAGANLAEALARLGRLDEAEAVIDEAEPLASSDDYVTHYLAFDARALIASRRGQHDHAIELTRNAITVVERTDAIEHQAMAHLVAAEVLVAAGRLTDAETALSETVHLAERKVLPVFVERARALAQP
jgi:tetratricopeptide (TPR) repeat protein